jgi:integrating conjugative element protein (TIGR03765 family)
MAGRSLPTVAAVLASVGSVGTLVWFSVSSLLGSFALVALLAFVVCAATAAPRAQELASAADNGPTLPIEAFLAERQPQGPRSELVSDMAVAFPVRNPGLRALALRGRPVIAAGYARWLTQPIALVADDARSRRWLTEQAAALLALNASILVVQVRSPQRMRAIRTHRPELAMAPAVLPSMVGALRHVGAAVYPLVIMPDGALLQDLSVLTLARPQTMVTSPGIEAR